MRGVFVAESSVPKRFRNGEGLLQCPAPVQQREGARTWSWGSFRTWT